METYCLSVRKILRTEIQVSEKLNKIDYYFYQIVLVVARSSCFIKQYSTVLSIFEMISLK